FHAARQAPTRHGSRARGANRGRFRDDAGAGRVRSRARSPVSNRGSGGSRERPRGWRSTATRGPRARGGSKEFEDLSAFSFGGRLLDGSLRRLLLGAADRVEALSQRFHQVDDFRRGFLRPRYDFRSGDFRIDDLLETLTVFIFVVGQIEWTLEGADDLPREFDLLGPHGLADRIQFFYLIAAPDPGGMCKVYMTMPRRCGRTATK